jgi:SAM-dependent methyltransferase
MGSTEPSTFYDQHPFDRVPADGPGPIRAVVSSPLADWIENLDANSLVLDIGCGPGRVLGFWARALYDENRGANVHSFSLVKELNQQIAHDADSPSAAEVLVAEKIGTA